jgi:thiol-disulfide isomerase/thioredoxin
MNNQLVNIVYLEGVDIDNNGNLMPHVGNGKPVLVLIQTNYCGYCSQAKPAYKELIAMVPNAVIATVQSDGGESDKLASSKLGKNKGQGVPSYLGFDKNGKFVRRHEGGRDANSLKNFISQI